MRSGIPAKETSLSKSFAANKFVEWVGNWCGLGWESGNQQYIKQHHQATPQPHADAHRADQDAWDSTWGCAGRLAEREKETPHPWVALKRVETAVENAANCSAFFVESVVV
eukprot:2757345-Amphidinium_carterae.2